MDKITNQPREVDASIRYQVGSVPILITIECRDRVAVQDSTWIEQLVQKGSNRSKCYYCSIIKGFYKTRAN